MQLLLVKNRGYRWYALTGTVNEEQRRIFGILSDITDMKVKEAAHRKLERVLQGMQEEYIGIYEVDLTNDSYTALLYQPSDIAGSPENGCYSETVAKLAEQLPAPEYEELFRKFGNMEYLRDKLSKEKRIELEYRIKSQQHSWRRNIYRAVEYRDGVPTRVALYQLDIDRQKTERLLQQQAIREAYDYAEAANAAKTELLSRMSHDIRTPMNAIIGMTAIAGTYIDNRERVRECLEKITVASRHLLSLINEVLDISKIESGKVELQEETFNLAELFDNMITMVLPQVKEHHHNLEMNARMKHEWVAGDIMRIQQAFMNLVTNSVKYTPDGGEIRVSLREMPSRNKGYGEYEITFEDSGIGMSEEFQKILFEPFTRAEDSRLGKVAGTGLGMTITRNVVRMMGGEIRVESELGVGTRFIVNIPLKIKEQENEGLEEWSGLPVLVVDDEADACESAGLILQEMGLSAEGCLSGREAVEKVRARHERREDYFAVILDWRMPDMDGIATAREIRRQVGGKSPVIFLSAYDSSGIEADARAAGVDKFISKPLFKSHLISSFRELKEEAPVAERRLEIFDRALDFSGKCVLLAEDNDLNAEIAEEILGMTGLKVEWARDGRAAVDCVERSPEGYYDLVFMDIQMPVMNGYDAASAIRRLEREDVRSLPIIAMTANAFVEDVNHAKCAGMDEHIAKPIDFRQLESLLIKYL